MMMRYLIFLFIFLLVSCIQTKKVMVNNSTQNDVCYKIIKIKSILSMLNGMILYLKYIVQMETLTMNICVKK